MRSLPVFFASLLVTLISLGCGNAVKGSDPKTTVNTVVLAPSITELSPAATPVNSVPFMMTVNGGNFGTASVVFWNGVPQHTTFITPNQLVVSLTPEDLQFTGLVKVYVLSGGLNSNTVDFNVTPQ
ncbi:MAG TPA: IPT/TIG domain-containing protein [Terriglobales bacterium]|nr:IPT/TIG domain-containing protein [Terriglobales bacterium]